MRTPPSRYYVHLFPGFQLLITLRSNAVLDHVVLAEDSLRSASMASLSAYRFVRRVHQRNLQCRYRFEGSWYFELPSIVPVLQVCQMKFLKADEVHLPES